jgi:hypothetical protein
MKTSMHKLVGLYAVLSVALLASGCAVDVGGGGVGVGVDVGPGYYDNCCYGGYYGGGWNAGYGVAPFRGEDHRFDHRGGGGGTHAYRPAAAGRAMPGIPSGGRGGGGGRKR